MEEVIVTKLLEFCGTKSQEILITQGVYVGITLALIWILIGIFGIAILKELKE